ncbi:hypothetical protein ACWCQQ_43660 [Streptomyces sp. NPDC002143]
MSCGDQTGDLAVRGGGLLEAVLALLLRATYNTAWPPRVHIIHAPGTGRPIG